MPSGRKKKRDGTPNDGGFPHRIPKKPREQKDQRDERGSCSIIAVTSAQAGSGKTSLAINLTSALSRRPKPNGEPIRILLVDMDENRDTTRFFHHNDTNTERCEHRKLQPLRGRVEGVRVRADNASLQLDILDEKSDTHISPDSFKVEQGAEGLLHFLQDKLAAILKSNPIGAPMDTSFRPATRFYSECKEFPHRNVFTSPGLDPESVKQLQGRLDAISKVWSTFSLLAIKNMFDNLRQKFDFIIIDVPTLSMCESSPNSIVSLMLMVVDIVLPTALADAQASSRAMVLLDYLGRVLNKRAAFNIDIRHKIQLLPFVVSRYEAKEGRIHSEAANFARTLRDALNQRINDGKCHDEILHRPCVVNRECSMIWLLLPHMYHAFAYSNLLNKTLVEDLKFKDIQEWFEDEPEKTEDDHRALKLRRREIRSEKAIIEYQIRHANDRYEYFTRWIVSFRFSGHWESEQRQSVEQIQEHAGPSPSANDESLPQICWGAPGGPSPDPARFDSPPEDGKGKAKHRRGIPGSAQSSSSRFPNPPPNPPPNRPAHRSAGGPRKQKDLPKSTPRTRRGSDLNKIRCEQIRKVMKRLCDEAKYKTGVPNVSISKVQMELKSDKTMNELGGKPQLREIKEAIEMNAGVTFFIDPPNNVIGFV